MGNTWFFALNPQKVKFVAGGGQQQPRRGPTVLLEKEPLATRHNGSNPNNEGFEGPDEDLYHWHNMRNGEYFIRVRVLRPQSVFGGKTVIISLQAFMCTFDLLEGKGLREFSDEARSRGFLWRFGTNGCASEGTTFEGRRSPGVSPAPKPFKASRKPLLLPVGGHIGETKRSLPHFGFAHLTAQSVHLRSTKENRSCLAFRFPISRGWRIHGLWALVPDGSAA